MSKKIQIAIPHLGEEEWLALKEPIETGWLTQGPKVAEFERLFAAHHKVQHACAVTSCTTGLHLALLASGIKAGDEVIVPAFTWVATANVVLHCGAIPIFCDVDTETFNIKVEDIASKISNKTRAIIPVHLFGSCADIDAIKAVIPSHVKIIEDAACAAGATYKGRPAGSLGDFGVFSFHPRKSVTTGEGGMVTTNNANYARIVQTLRNHGAEIPEETRHASIKPHLLPDFKVLGFNYRMTDLQAAVGTVQIKKLSKFIQERQQWTDYYTEKLHPLSWIKPQRLMKDNTHAWQAYVCSINPEIAPLSRDDIMDYLYEKGISSRPGTHAVHMLSYYREKYNFKPEDFPGARDCSQNTIALPLHNQMVKEDYDYVIQAIQEL